MNEEQLELLLMLTRECRKRALWRPEFFASYNGTRKSWQRRVSVLREYRKRHIMPPPSFVAYIEAELADAAVIAAEREGA